MLGAEEEGQIWRVGLPRGGTQGNSSPSDQTQGQAGEMNDKGTLIRWGMFIVLGIIFLGFIPAKARLPFLLLVLLGGATYVDRTTPGGISKLFQEKIPGLPDKYQQ
jgi:hypothetical protein